VAKRYSARTLTTALWTVRVKNYQEVKENVNDDVELKFRE
jgi:hypothetical protein